MSVFDRLATMFGLRPLLGWHDLDLLDEPGNSPDSVDPVSRRELLGQYTASTMDWPTSVAPCVDGPAVTSLEASAAGHPNLHDLSGIGLRELVESSEDILRDKLQEIVTRMAAVVRESTAVVELVQEIDPTPVGLARASQVTDINSKRK